MLNHRGTVPWWKYRSDECPSTPPDSHALLYGDSFPTGRHRSTEDPQYDLLTLSQIAARCGFDYVIVAYRRRLLHRVAAGSERDGTCFHCKFSGITEPLVYAREQMAHQAHIDRQLNSGLPWVPLSYQSMKLNCSAEVGGVVDGINALLEARNSSRRVGQEPDAVRQACGSFHPRDHSGEKQRISGAVFKQIRAWERQTPELRPDRRHARRGRRP